MRLISRAIELALRLYPAAWRARYEHELRAMLEHTAPRWRDVFDLARGALTEWRAEARDPGLHPITATMVFAIRLATREMWLAVPVFLVAVAIAAALRHIVGAPAPRVGTGALLGYLLIHGSLFALQMWPHLSRREQPLRLGSRAALATLTCTGCSIAAMLWAAPFGEGWLFYYCLTLLSVQNIYEVSWGARQTLASSSRR